MGPGRHNSVLCCCAGRHRHIAQRRTKECSGAGEKTGKSKGTITQVLQSHLLPNKVVIRTKRGVYALPETEPPYIRKFDAIVAALAEGPMTLCGTDPRCLHAIWLSPAIHSSAPRKAQGYSHQTRRLCLAWRGAGLRYNRRRNHQSFGKEADETPCIGGTYQ